MRLRAVTLLLLLFRFGDTLEQVHEIEVALGDDREADEISLSDTDPLGHLTRSDGEGHGSDNGHLGAVVVLRTEEEGLRPPRDHSLQDFDLETRFEETDSSNDGVEALGKTHNSVRSPSRSSLEHHSSSNEGNAGPEFTGSGADDASEIDEDNHGPGLRKHVPGDGAQYVVAEQEAFGGTPGVEGEDRQANGGDMDEEIGVTEKEGDDTARREHAEMASLPLDAEDRTTDVETDEGAGVSDSQDLGKQSQEPGEAVQSDHVESVREVDGPPLHAAGTASNSEIGEGVVEALSSETTGNADMEGTETGEEDRDFAGALDGGEDRIVYRAEAAPADSESKNSTGTSAYGSGDSESSPQRASLIASSSSPKEGPVTDEESDLPGQEHQPTTRRRMNQDGANLSTGHFGGAVDESSTSADASISVGREHVLGSLADVEISGDAVDITQPNRVSPEHVAQIMKSVEAEIAKKLAAEEHDAKSLLDIWVETAREYVLTQTVPRTDAECDFNWTRLRCEPKCLCGSRLRFGDYTPGRTCRLLHPWERNEDCRNTWDPSDEPALRRLGAAAVWVLGSAKRAYDARVAPPTDAECTFDVETRRCEPRSSCRFKFRFGDLTLNRACRLTPTGASGDQ